MAELNCVRPPLQTHVDDKFRVHTIVGLRVVDASVIPKIICANLNAPVRMIAARAGDYILDQDQLNPVEPEFSFPAC